MRSSILVLAVACSGSGSPPAPDGYVSSETAVLGMNDVSILLPLPGSAAAPVIAPMQGLVPGDLFTALVTQPGDVLARADAFHVIAVRFDLCDRPRPGPCPVGEDGRLRLVFQPVRDTPEGTRADDVALHAFYPIPNGELGGVVDELRRMAAIAGAPADAPLRVAAPSVTYAERLRTLVMTYAGATKLTRLTLFAQNARVSSLSWAFRGQERATPAGQFQPIIIPQIEWGEQRTILTGADTTYMTWPVADAPAGFALAIDAQAFVAAAAAERAGALEAMAAIDNPIVHTAETVQCVGCHVTTFLAARRAQSAGVDPASVAGRYASTFDLSPRITSNRSLRAFGYLFAEPQISQRVVNDTAQVLAEIGERFPPAVAP